MSPADDAALTKLAVERAAEAFYHSEGLHPRGLSWSDLPGWKKERFRRAIRHAVLHGYITLVIPETGPSALDGQTTLESAA